MRYLSIGFIAALVAVQLGIYIGGTIAVKNDDSPGTDAENGEDREDMPLSAAEYAIYGVLKAVGTLGADGEYTESLELAQAIFKDAPKFGAAARFYIVLINFVAPVLGGAWLSSVFLTWFPRFRLLLYCSNFSSKKKTFCYFSELNERSLHLAQSIIEKKLEEDAAEKAKETAEKQKKKEEEFEKTNPVIIFTDTYVDDESEEDSELLEEAKRIGAIFVRDDLMHVRQNKKGKRKFFLIDMEEVSNLQTLTDLANEENCAFLKGAEVYIFSQDDICAHVQEQVTEQLVEFYYKAALMQEKRDGGQPDANGEQASEKEKENDAVSYDEKLKQVRPLLPTLIPVQSYRNLIQMLLTEVPLYEPLIYRRNRVNEEGKQKLHVTILGTGQIGTEAFLTVTWMGQLLDVDLHITVVSQEKEDDFKGRINYINPEILKVTEKDDPLLQIYRNQPGSADPYFTFDYKFCNVKSEQFQKYFTNVHDPNTLLRTDYFIVALGTDEDNLSVSEHIREYIGGAHLQLAYEQEKKDISQGKEHAGEVLYQPTVISYVIFDADLCEAMKEKPESIQYGIYMHPFGSLREAFSTDTIFMDTYIDQAKESRATYQALQRRETKKAKKEKFRDDYTMWSDLAKAVHESYKLFAIADHLSEARCRELKCFHESVFDGMVADQRSKAVETKIQSIKDCLKQNKELNHQLAWLEHRRWNAYMRSKGFRSTEYWTVYFEQSVKQNKQPTHKNMNLKLHPCIVECDKNGKLFHGENLDCYAKKQTSLDLLDELTYALMMKYKALIEAKDGREYNIEVEDEAKELARRLSVVYRWYDFKEYDYFGS